MRTKFILTPKIFNLKMPFSVLTCSLLLIACGGDGNSTDSNQVQAINTTEASLTLQQDNKSQTVQAINSTAISIKDGQQDAPYLYRQSYERINNQFQRNLDFNYTFSANSTEYQVRAIYSNLKNQPDYFSIWQKNAQKEESFSCHKYNQICNGISVNIDEKTG